MSGTDLITCMFFSGNAQEAAEHYTGIFKDSSIDRVNHFTAAGPGPEGAVVSVEFTLNGRSFVALNGPPLDFTQAISLQIPCADQAEVDHYWDALTAGGEEGRAGWLKDRFGVSWQVVPAALADMLGSPDRAKAAQAAKVMMSTQGKMNVAALQQAFDGA